MNGSVTVHSEGSAPDLSGTDEEALRRLRTASWWRVRGRDRSRCRVVTTLLHGNEPSGFRAIRAWTASGGTPAVDLFFFVCSVETALSPPMFSIRSRPDGRDQNRCFAPPFSGPEGRRAESLLALIEKAAPEAVVDLHNNTGHSPAYGVGTLVEPTVLGLTALFADRFMHSDLRMGTLMEALEGQVPSVVIECGRAGDPVADATALAGLERLATLESIESCRAMTGGVEVLVKPLRVGLVGGIGLAFGDAPTPGATFTVRRDVDRHNFKAMREGEVVGWLDERAPWPIVAAGSHGVDRSEDLFIRIGNEVRLRRPIVPVMMTTSVEIAKSDCLFYALERVSNSRS